MATFETSIRLGTSVDDVFTFFLNPHHRSLLSPPAVHIHVVNSPNPLVSGAQIEIKVQAKGFAQHLVHEVIEIKPNALMVERQIKGPLKLFIHRLAFQAEGESITRMQNHIEFLPPGGFLGMIATEKRILESLHTTFHYLHGQLHHRFGNPSDACSQPPLT